MELEQKTVLITGASSGIGEASARLFAREGARLVLSARRRARLDALVDEIISDGGEAVALSGDVTEPDHADELVALAQSRFGGLDVAFNNAGTLGELGPLDAMSDQAWRMLMQTNLDAAFYGARAQIPALKHAAAGSLIFTSSFVGHTMGLPGMAAYGASKSALVGFTQCLAAELGADGVRVNALMPGGTLTEMAGTDPVSHQRVAGMHALGRMASAEEIARAALFLASPASSFVTGTGFLVDGGNSIFKG